MHRAKIELVDLAALDLLVHHAERLRSLRGNHDAARIAVDAVAKRRGEALLGIGIVFAPLIEVGLDLRDQRIGAFMLILVHRNAGALVREQNIFILIKHREARMDRGEAMFGPRRAEELLGQKALHAVPLGEHLRCLRTLAVHLDLFESDGLVEQGSGQMQGLRNKLVKPLPGIVFSDLQLVHRPHILSFTYRL